MQNDLTKRVLAIYGRIFRVVLSVCLLGCLSGDPCFAAGANRVLLIDDFDDMTTSNLLGGETQGDEENVEGCIPSFTPQGDSSFGHYGHSLQLDYDVSQPHSFSFYWTRLGGPGAVENTLQTRDLSAYNYLSFWYKAGGQMPRFAVEVHYDTVPDGKFILGKDTASKVIAAHYMDDQKWQAGTWHKLIIPFRDFPKMPSWEDIFEYVFVFDHALHSGKGRIFIDDILLGSNYPHEQKEADVQFPGSSRVQSFTVNDRYVKAQFVLSTDNHFSLSLDHPSSVLERVSIEVSEQGTEKWQRVCSFFDHALGYYRGSWNVDEGKKKYYLVRVVAMDIFGREKVLKGPLRGIFLPSQKRMMSE